MRKVKFNRQTLALCFYSRNAHMGHFHRKGIFQAMEIGCFLILTIPIASGEVICYVGRGLKGSILGFIAIPTDWVL